MGTYKEESEKAKNIRRLDLPQTERNILPLEKKTNGKKPYSVEAKWNGESTSKLASTWYPYWRTKSRYRTLRDAINGLTSTRKSWLAKHCNFRITENGVPLDF